VARTVLITGAAGFAGAHITRALLERGDSVVALDLAPSLPAFITKGIEEAAVTYVVGDVTDCQQLATLVRDADVQDIVHSAAAMGDRDSLERPLHFLRVNAEAVWGLCDVARRLPVRRLVCMSSRSVYGEYDPRSGPIAEDAAPRPIGFYGASKAAADIVAVQYRRHFGVDVVLPRVTGLYGPEQYTGQNPLAKMVDAAVREEPFALELDGTYRYEVTYVKDVARGVLAMLDAPALQWAIYNIGTGLQPTLAELGEIVRQVLPRAEITFRAVTATEAPPRAVMAIDRFANETGFQTAWTVEQGVRELVHWHRTGEYGCPIGNPPQAVTEL
jgi:nucleoside-diphosphate-sugar epimerase